MICDYSCKGVRSGFWWKIQGLCSNAPDTLVPGGNVVVFLQPPQLQGLYVYDIGSNKGCFLAVIQRERYLISRPIITTSGGHYKTCNQQERRVCLLPTGLGKTMSFILTPFLLDEVSFQRFYLLLKWRQLKLSLFVWSLFRNSCRSRSHSDHSDNVLSP